jgi:hypothetical protein
VVGQQSEIVPERRQVPKRLNDYIEKAIVFAFVFQADMGSVICHH